MGGLHNTLRRLVAGGSPVVTGLQAVGDNVCTANPTLGRGLSLAIQGAADLADALERCGEHATDLALALDERAGDHVAPFYADQAGIDAARLAALRNAISGAPPPSAPAVPGRVTFAQLRGAAPYDPLIFRAYWKVMGMSCRPGDVYTDPAIAARAHEIIRSRGTSPPMTQPTRERLLTALAPAPEHRGACRRPAQLPAVLNGHVRRPAQLAEVRCPHVASWKLVQACGWKSRPGRHRSAR